jgi:hypothetical protein
MFTPQSRYYGVPVDQVTAADGRSVGLVRFPLRTAPALLGYHPVTEGQRLDHLAAAYLQDPTAFWILCDANGTIAPDALAARPLVGIPRQGS